MTLAAGELWRIDVADCRQWLATLPAGSVHCVVTSPPYYGLRDYDMSGQIGLEKTPAEYVAEMVSVFREVRRVLRDDGTVWLNLGDSYANTPVGTFNGGTEIFKGRDLSGHAAGSQTNKLKASGLKQKDLIGVPWRVAFALQADAWYLRSDIIWAKRSPMPESVRDRPTKAHEYLFMLSKRPTYYYDAYAVREKLAAASAGRYAYRFGGAKSEALVEANKDGVGQRTRVVGNRDTPTGRNKRTVWTLSNDPFKGAHFAVMPKALVKPCILAGTSEEGVCPHCGAPWRRVIERRKGDSEASARPKQTGGMSSRTSTLSLSGNGSKEWAERGGKSHTTGWQPGCRCEANTPVPAVVLDPFAGAGTTLYVATKYGRRGLGCELNPEYAAIARKRIKRLTDGRLFA